MRKAVLFPLFVLACSAETTPKAPQAPRWLDAPTAPVALRQGVEVTLPLHLDRTGAKATVVAPEGITAAVAADGASLHLRASYAVADDADVTVTLKTDDGAPATTVAVRAHVVPLGWIDRQTWSEGEGPQAREHASLFLDEETRVVYMLQGTGYAPQWKPIDDNWQLDLAHKTWSRWNPTGDVPEPGATRRAVHVPGTKVYYLYGGSTGFQETEVGDPALYRVDLGNPAHTFTKLTQVGAPERTRMLHAFGYDAEKKIFVVFGGVFQSPDEQALLSDTWTFTLDGDTATWKEVKSPQKPSARYGAFYATDSTSHRFFVWSGAQQPKGKDMVNPATDLWALDLAAPQPTWSTIETAGVTPRGRRNGCWIHDPKAARLFVFGGTPDGSVSTPGLFALDLRPGHEEWSTVSAATPPPRSSGSGFFDPVTGRGYCGFGNDRELYRDMNVLGYPE